MVVFALSLSRLLLLLLLLLPAARHIPLKMKLGKMPDSKKWRQITGEQLELRGILNLYSGLLDVPDDYWEHPDLEALFESMQDQLDIPERIKILNQRMDYAKDITDIVRDYLHTKSSHNMEVSVALLSVWMG